MFVSSRIFNQSSIIVFERELRFRSKGKKVFDRFLDSID